MRNVFTLTGNDLRVVAEMTTRAYEDSRPLHVAIDGGVKVKVGEGMWTPPMGTEVGARPELPEGTDTNQWGRPTARGLADAIANTSLADTREAVRLLDAASRAFLLGLLTP